MPKFVIELLMKKNYSAQDIALIEANWFYYADQGFRFGSASERQLLRECSIVLACAQEQDLS